MDNPLVTVYITNYNYAQFLEQSIESVLNQTFRNFELIVIDDGSTDLSHKIIWNYQNNPFIRVIFQENRGLVASINVALKASRGRYIMRLDADDYLDPNALLVLTETIKKDPGLALVYADYFYVDEFGKVVGQERRNNIEKEVTLYDQPAHGACTLFRKRVLLEIGTYNESRTCQDGYEIWLKIIEKYPVKNINLPLFYYRRHGKNLTENEKQILETRLAIKREHVKKLRISELKCLAVVPVRGSIIERNCPTLENLGDKPVIEWTLQAADKVPQIIKKVISTPDPEIIRYVLESKKNWKIHYRSKEKAIENMPLNQTLLDVLEDIKIDFSPDAIVQLTPITPFRSERSIEEAIHTMKIFDVDMVIGVIPDEGTFYRHRGKGLEPLSELDYGHDLRLERERLYRRVGGLQVISVEFLKRKERWNKPKIGHVIMDMNSTLVIRDAYSLNNARKYLAENGDL